MKSLISGGVAASSLLALSLSLVAPAAAAQPTDEPPPPNAEAVPPPAVASNPDVPVLPAEPRYDLIRVNAGIKIGYVPTGAFDPYASNNVLPQFSVDATYPVLVQNKLVIGVGLGWDGGGRSDKVRGFESSLATHRVYVPLEARYHFLPGVYGFGKIAPGAAAMLATIQEGSSSNELKATGWAFAADASVGASILLGPRKKMEQRSIRLWATPEFGYAFTTKATLDANRGREDKDLLGSDENTNLRALALSGFFWRASVGATF